ncbi:MAG: TAXI family TRAP transporter solute-binding subunit [Burkholderiales bacterium]
MALDHLAFLTRRELLRTVLIFGVAIGACLWLSFRWLQPIPPRRIVIATGVEGGLYAHFAQRYRTILARDGVTLEIRPTRGAAENIELLQDPNSGVDLAFVQGGLAQMPQAEHLAMVAALYYEALWIFHRADAAFTQMNQLKGLRIAVGPKGGGTQAFAMPLLRVNGLQDGDATFIEAGGDDALALVRDGRADVAMLVGGGAMHAVQEALHDPALKLMSLSRTAAYARRFPYITRLTLPAGTIDLARNIPASEVDLIGTKAMLVARDTLHPALTTLLLEAVRDEHDDQGYFEAAGEFPNANQVDIPVLPDAVRHHRIGQNFLYRVLPFWVAAFVERTAIVIVPLLVVLVPLINFLPQIVRWRVRSRVYRWYGELALLEREVARHEGVVPLENWVARLDRIERAVAGIRMPASFASEAYTLREHVDLVRNAIVTRGAQALRPTAESGSTESPAA